MKNKIILFAVLILLNPATATANSVTNETKVLVNTGNVANGETNTSDAILKLLVQIEALTKQVEKIKLELEVQKNEDFVAKESVKSYEEGSTILLLRTLTIGTKGEDVEKLQSFLAKDKEMYPEALVTGFYGKLTKEAVKKYQEKNGLESVGIVGPKTRKLINDSFLENDPFIEKIKDEAHLEEDNFIKGIDLEVGTGNGKVYWSVGENKLENALIVLWSKESEPTYPTRAKDIWVYFEDYTNGHLKLEPRDGYGNYYVRVCSYDTSTNSCAFYSNQVEIELK